MRSSWFEQNTKVSTGHALKWLNSIKNKLLIYAYLGSLQRSFSDLLVRYIFRRLPMAYATTSYL